MNNLIAINIGNYIFLEPNWLWLLLLLPFFWYFFNQLNTKGKFHFKFSQSIADSGSRLVDFLPRLLNLFFLTTLVFLIFALAKPQNVNIAQLEKDYSEGIDIVIALDISGSMLATDFQPNRLEAAKKVAKDFVDIRPSDRIGLVVYEGEAYTACPATKNHDFLKKSISDLQSGWLVPGTAIGTGLGTAVARLQSDTLKTKVVILLSDGENNSGSVMPLEAAEMAKEKGIKVYTIGVGKEGYTEMPVNTPFGTIMQSTLVKIDEKLLKSIAKMTNGQYFRAVDNNSLKEIYNQIDSLEKNIIYDELIEREPPVHPSFWLMAMLSCFSLFVVISYFLKGTHEG